MSAAAPPPSLKTLERGCFQWWWQKTAVFYCGEALPLPCQGVHYVEKGSHNPVKWRHFFALWSTAEVFQSLVCSGWNMLQNSHIKSFCGLDLRNPLVIIGWKLQSQVQLQLCKYALKSSGSQIWHWGFALRCCTRNRVIHSNNFPSERKKKKQKEIIAFIESCPACRNHITFHNSQVWLQVVGEEKRILIKEKWYCGLFSYPLTDLLVRHLWQQGGLSCVAGWLQQTGLFSSTSYPKQTLTLNSACQPICVINADNVSQSNLLVAKPWAVKFVSCYNFYCNDLGERNENNLKHH